jgi:HD-GYP domain-containing protein (c-di-GMP phosphodiesterase class II)
MFPASWPLGYCRRVPDDLALDGSVRTAEVIATLSLATDLGIGVPREHGLESTLIAMRLADRLGVDPETAAQTYYACLLFYVGCTANADVAAEIFGADDSLTLYATPARFGSRAEMVAGFLRAIAPPGSTPLIRARQLAYGIPRIALVFKEHLAAFCEVADMLSDRLGLPRSVGTLFNHVAERWDGKGQPGRAKHDQMPLSVRITHVARDAAFQRMLGGGELAARVIGGRAGHAFDPHIAAVFMDDSAEILASETSNSAWDETLAVEPHPWLTLEGEAIDRALAAMGDFTDLSSPYLVGHSAGVAELAASAAERCGLAPAEVVLVRRAGLVHDLGRVAVPVRIWQKQGALTADEWERVRLHPYHTERLLMQSPCLSQLAPVASSHHERLDGSGYHRGLNAATLALPARLLAAADAYHAMTEPRAHREPFSPEQAAETLGEECRAGLFDADAVAAVLDTAGQAVPRSERPAGLTEREAQVIALLARGLQTKQIAGLLGISAKTADRHIEHAYRKIGVSTRAAAALFAMEHGLATLGKLPIAPTGQRS